MACAHVNDAHTCSFTVSSRFTVLYSASLFTSLATLMTGSGAAGLPPGMPPVLQFCRMCCSLAVARKLCCASERELTVRRCSSRLRRSIGWLRKKEEQNGG